MQDDKESAVEAAPAFKNGQTDKQSADKIEDAVADPAEPDDTVDDATYRQLSLTRKLMKVFGF